MMANRYQLLSPEGTLLGYLMEEELGSYPSPPPPFPLPLSLSSKSDHLGNRDEGSPHTPTPQDPSSLPSHSIRYRRERTPSYPTSLLLDQLEDLRLSPFSHVLIHSRRSE
jgi:hypothetical protein